MSFYGEQFSHDKIQHIMRLDVQNATLTAKCYRCEETVGMIVLAQATYLEGSLGGQPIGIKWLWCRNCGQPSTAIDGSVYPVGPEGSPIPSLPPTLKKTYEEIRMCTMVNAWSAVSILCRKLIMHIAVEKKADENKSFVHYLKYLEDNGFVGHDLKKLADKIRIQGNKANHEIEDISNTEGKKIFVFTFHLLTSIYVIKDQLDD